MPGCGGAAIGEPRASEACTPDCGGKECGDDGCGGSCGTCNGSDRCNNISGLCVASVGLVWTDSIQTGSEPFGFDEWLTEHPIDNPVAPKDSNGVNLSRVPDPLGGGGYAVREYATFDGSGSRAETGIWSFSDPAFGELATSGQPVYMAQEWYFPEVLSAGGHYSPWIALWDWHSTGPDGNNRWHTAPGLVLAADGSMKFEFGWGNGINGASGHSTVGLPVGEWFDIEMRYQWTAGTTTLSVWINGELVLEQSGVRTRASNHTRVEVYGKFYGSTEGGAAWSPTPSIKYTRNVRISGERIWQ